jgi:hypothetical protein
LPPRPLPNNASWNYPDVTMKSNLFKITIIFALLNFHFLVFDANAQSNGTPAIMTDGSKLSGSWRKPEELIAKSDDGSQDFVGNGLTETIHNKTSLTKEEAASMAKAYLAQVFPEFSQRLSLKNVNQQISGVLPKTGAAVAWPSGYLVQFSVVKDGVPIWDNYVNVRIAADQVERVNFQVYNQTQEEGAGTIQPLGADASLTKALPAIKKRSRNSVEVRTA